jgi:hypothetical protein
MSTLPPLPPLPPGYEELAGDCRKFLSDHPDIDRNVFIMTRFVPGNALLTLLDQELRRTLCRHGLNALRADDRMYPTDRQLWKNVCVYMLCCRYGVAVLEDRIRDEFNPNVALEYGFMRALDKPTLLLKDAGFHNLRADILGTLHETFDLTDIAGSLARPIESWIRDLGLDVEPGHPSSSSSRTRRTGACSTSAAPGCWSTRRAARRSATTSSGTSARRSPATASCCSAAPTPRTRPSSTRRRMPSPSGRTFGRCPASSSVSRPFAEAALDPARPAERFRPARRRRVLARDRPAPAARRRRPRVHRRPAGLARLPHRPGGVLGRWPCCSTCPIRSCSCPRRWRCCARSPWGVPGAPLPWPAWRSCCGARWG